MPHPEDAQPLTRRRAASWTMSTGAAEAERLNANIPFEGPVDPVPPSNDWWTAPLPEGVVWYRQPGRGRRDPSLAFTAFTGYSATWTLDQYREWATGVFAWADHYGLVLFVCAANSTHFHASLPSHLYVKTIAEASAIHNWRRFTPDLLNDVECCLCRNTHMDAFQEGCPGDANDYWMPHCSNDGWVSHADVRVWRDATYCTNCLHECAEDECTEMATPRFQYCNECVELQAFCGMGDCNAPIECFGRDDFEGVSIEGVWFCESCSEFQCQLCRYVYREDAITEGEDGRFYCSECFSRSGTEELDENDTIRADRLRIRTIPGREQIRMCGIEIEGGNGTSNGSRLAQKFYDVGVSSADGVAGYHHGRGLGFAHVERDSSVDWEAVIGPVNMADQEDVRRLNLTVRTIRSMIHDDELRLDMRCGLHIHVGAERVSLDGAFNLNTLFAYIEDPFYRLAAARWPMHRAINNSHYTQPVPKQARTKVEFGRLISSAERYYALSFTNYINAMLNNCECGAVRYDAWSECTCPSLGKCTFEFRLFNSTANPTKLHAYLAVTQALVAKALSMDPAERSNFDSLEFIPRRFKDMPSVQQEDLLPAWDERLAWMFNELPLTQGEKNSLLYVARNSELQSLGEDRLAEIANGDVQTTIETEVSA